MLKLAIIILLAHIPFSSEPSDEGAYNFFSKMLEEAEKCLEDFVNERQSDLVEKLYQKAKLTASEVEFYEAKGVKSNASIAVKPFLLLSDGILKLNDSQEKFLRSLPNPAAYQDARDALASMIAAIEEIELSISQIEEIEFWNGLKFDTSEIREDLIRAKRLISYYESLLEKFEVEGIFVSVSKDKPFIYEQIAIYVHAVKVEPRNLFIDGKAYEAGKVFLYRFDELGLHKIWAEGLKDGEVVRSNVVYVEVIKIPTKINLFWRNAYIKEEVKLRGLLSDYYGNPIDAEILLEFDGNSKKIETKNGSFELPLRKEKEGYLNVSAFYKGNETYESSKAEASIFFSRFPVYIKIDADKDDVEINEPVNFLGSISIDANVSVFVNSEKKMDLYASRNFNFSLSFDRAGEYVVFVHFAGNDTYKPAESNRVKIVVSGPKIIKIASSEVKISSKIPLFFILIAAAVVSLLGSMKLKGRLEKRKRFEEVRKEEFKEKEVQKEIPRDVSKAYEVLFRNLAKKYGLSLALTPRELLESLKKEPFYEKLKKITEMHEMYVYGGREIDKEAYFRMIEEI